MSENAIHCPEKTTLQGFLEGALDDNQQKVVESHLLDCLNCEDTIRMLGVNDTFDELAQSALAKIAHEHCGDDESIVADLIEKMRGIDQSTGFIVSKPRRDMAKRMLINEQHERASEVICQLLPSDDEQILGLLGEYEVIELIGVGSSGVVFRARDTQLDRFIALKVLRPSLGSAARKRFLLEARAAAAIDHENVIMIHQVGEQGSLAFIAMQLLPGETLETKLEREATIPPAESQEIARQIAHGLQAAHKLNMIHRDIKPANIWLDSERDRVKILDFGLARVTDDDPKFTDTGMIAGTPTFMSPEQARGSEIDARSDLFSLGCVLYRMLTGELPFYGKNVLATLQSIQRDEPVPPAHLNANIPHNVSQLTRCLLAKHPEQRPDNIEQLLEAFDTQPAQWAFEVPEVTQVTRPQSSAAGSGSRIWKWIAILGGLAAFSAAAMFFGDDVVRIMTDQGELVIKTNDPDIKIRVSQNGQDFEILDVKTQQSFNLRSGVYELSPTAGDANEVTFSREQVTMTRNGKTVVTVTRSDSTADLAGNRETGMMPPGQSAGLADNSETPIYQGLSLENWLGTVRRERSTDSLTRALGAFELLMDDDNAPQIAESLELIYSIYGKDKILDVTRGHNGSTFYSKALSLFGKLPEPVFIESFERIISKGDIKQRHMLLNVIRIQPAYEPSLVSKAKSRTLQKNADSIIAIFNKLKVEDLNEETNIWLTNFVPLFIHQFALTKESTESCQDLLTDALGDSDQLSTCSAAYVLAKFKPDTEDLMQRIIWLADNAKDKGDYRLAQLPLQALVEMGERAEPAYRILYKACLGHWGGFTVNELQILAIEGLSNIPSKAEESRMRLNHLYEYGSLDTQTEELIRKVYEKLDGNLDDLSSPFPSQQPTAPFPDQQPTAPFPDQQPTAPFPSQQPTAPAAEPTLEGESEDRGEE